MNDLQRADLQAAAYAATPTMLGPFDRYFEVDGHVRCFLAHDGDTSHVVFPGTDVHKIEDILCDAAGVPVERHDIGFVDGGFAFGLDDLLDAMLPYLLAQVEFEGHSLGASRAILEAAILVKRFTAHVVLRCTTWGTPRPGFTKLGNVLIGASVGLRHYQNRDSHHTDPVTLVPSIPITGGDLYRTPVAPTDLAAPDIVFTGPLATIEERLALHSFDLYHRLTPPTDGAVCTAANH